MIDIKIELMGLPIKNSLGNLNDGLIYNFYRI